MKRFAKLGWLCAIVILLSGCAAEQRLNNNVKHTISANQTEIQHQKNRYLRAKPVLVKRHGYYIDTQPISLAKSPAWLRNRISLTGEDLPFSFYINKLLAHTNVNVSYEPGLNLDKTLTLRFNGTVKAALQRIAAKTGYAYSLYNNRLTWSDRVIKTFDVSFMPGASNYSVGGNGSNKSTQNAAANGAVYFGGNSNGAHEFSNLKGKLSIWEDLAKTLNQLKSKDGKVMVSEATTTVTVDDHPANVRAMAKYIRKLNKELSRQVAIQVKILEVDLDSNFNYGINWKLIHEALGAKLGIVGALGNPIRAEALGANPGGATGFTINVDKIGSPSEGTDMLINALRQQGRVSVSTEPRVITLNDQMAEIGINNLQGYLEQVTNVQTPLVGNTESLTPGIVKSGLSLYILPRILGNKVYLQISSNLSRLKDIQSICGGGQAQGSTACRNVIQVPSLSEKSFNQRSVVQSGNTLIIAGFKQLEDTQNKAYLFTAKTAQGVSRKNVETIVLITPTILGSS